MNENLLEYAMNRFERDSNYPNHPGYKSRDTSKEAAARVSNVSEMKQRILGLLRCRDLSDDELARTMGLGVHKVRPRRSELTAAGLIVDSGDRVLSPEGRNSIVWRLA